MLVQTGLKWQTNHGWVSLKAEEDLIFGAHHCPGRFTETKHPTSSNVIKAGLLLSNITILQDLGIKCHKVYCVRWLHLFLKNPGVEHPLYKQHGCYLGRLPSSAFCETLSPAWSTISRCRWWCTHIKVFSLNTGGVKRSHHWLTVNCDNTLCSH